MRHLHQNCPRSLIACAVLSALGTAAAHAERGATLSVRAAGTAAPQVRSVQRDTADNEVVSATANETVELLLADGTSLTLAQGTTLNVQRYRFDRASRAGELRLRVDQGAVRIVGGALNNSSEIAIAVPGAVITLDNAVAVVQVASGRNDIALIAGRRLAVRGARETRTLSAAGSALALDAAGAFTGAPEKLSVTEQQRLANLVNPGLATGVVPNFVVDAAVDAAGEDGSSGTQTSAETRTVAEDDTAKEVRVTPVLPDPVAPANPCVSGSCVAGAPNFDLGTSVGAIYGRQHGRTLGATWRRVYSAGDAVANFGIINTPPADYSPTGGFRSTTARIFAANPATPYSLTLTGAAAPLVINNTGVPGYQCFAGSSEACHSAPIVTFDGLSYRLAGFNLGSLTEDLQLDFQYPFYMSDGEFGPYEAFFSVPIDYAAPGVLQSRSVNTVVNQCYKAPNNDSCFEFYGDDEPSRIQRDAALANPAFLQDYSGWANGGNGLFSEYYVVLTPRDLDQFNNVAYTIDVSYTGTSNYDIHSLQSGFHRITVSNYQSEFLSICDLRPGDTGGACFDLARDLFGSIEQFPGDQIGVPVFNFDIDPFTGEIIDVPFPNEASADLVIRDDDSFLVVDAVSRLPGDNQRLFYATGTVSGDLAAGTAAQGITLDRFTLSPGLAPNGVLGRAFMRPDTLLNIAPATLLSSDLLVLNPAYATTVSATPARALHYDFAVSGNGAAQSSTISVTLGSLTYDPAGNAAQLAGRTVGSTARAGATRYSGSVESALFSTAAGGGNPNLAGTGRAGYLVLENYDPVSAPNGGFERTVENTSAATTNYALLRFARVGSGGTQAAPARTSSADITGYVGGIAEVTSATGAGNTVTVQPLISGNLALATDAATGAVSASFSAQLGAAGAPATTVTLGGANRLSAFTGPKEYAAMTASAPNIGAGNITDAGAANAAIISGAPLVADAARGWTGALTADERTRLTGYRHLQWGFFFGDVSVSGTQAAHAHLASWVGGRAAVATAPLPTGSADYSGHVFANVSNGTQLYSAAGTYANHWDFATRSGTGTMSFDNASYSLSTRMLGLRRDGTTIASDSTTVFEGLISNAGTRDYIGSLNGNFVSAAGAAPTDGLAQRAAVAGGFALDTVRDGNAYRAVGTFGAERTGP